MRKSTTFLITGALLLVIFSSVAWSDAGYSLKFSTQKSNREYSSEAKTIMNFHADNMPLPGAFMDVRNIEMSEYSTLWIETLDYDQAQDVITFSIREDVDKIRMGYEFFQMPPLEQFMEELSKGNFPMGPHHGNKDSKKMKKLFNKGCDDFFQMKYKMTPQGKLISIDMDIPAELDPKAKLALPMMSSMLAQLAEPIFPDAPVRVGDTWTQNVNLDNVPVAEMPKMVINHSLEGVDKFKGHDIGRMNSRARYHYDIPMGNKVKGERMQYWRDKEFDVLGVRPYVDVYIDAYSHFDITGGFLVKKSVNGKMVFGCEMELKKVSGHAKNQIWKPNFEMTVIISETSSLK